MQKILEKQPFMAKIWGNHKCVQQAGIIQKAESDKQNERGSKTSTYSTNTVITFKQII
jgi:hypothetical protein